MRDERSNPILRIGHSPRFSLDVQLSNAQRITSVGYIEWQFCLRCQVQDSTGGRLTYLDEDLHSLDLGSFERLHAELQSIRDGKGTEAGLVTFGLRTLFGLHLKGRRLEATIRLPEFQEETSVFAATFAVDYDLFVNRLSDQLKEFIDELREVKPVAM